MLRGAGREWGFWGSTSISKRVIICGRGWEHSLDKYLQSKKLLAIRAPNVSGQRRGKVWGGALRGFVLGGGVRPNLV